MRDDFEASVAAALKALAEAERARETARFVEAIGGSMPDAEYISRRRSAEAE